VELSTFPAIGDPGWLPAMLAARMVNPPTTPVKEMKLLFATVVKPAPQLPGPIGNELSQDTAPPEVSVSAKIDAARAGLLPITMSAAIKSEAQSGRHNAISLGQGRRAGFTLVGKRSTGFHA
jgi:hypothetical protein